jgi:ATP-binding cassette subfamily A (ABC1) protein 3
VKADHLRKLYGNKVACKDVSFGLNFGDCFALLGVNGAGKTSTFKMLTGEVVPTKGDSFIVSHNVLTNFSEARKQIGYCPQFDAIFGLMTVREHLEFYAMIKKIPTRLVQDLIRKQIKDMNLEQYENKNAGTLSGGNKRKLSVAMSMIGNPPVVFLDEPSAGMDPKARRFMWEIIAKISTRGKNSAVILTTHSMEEAEALSTSMGIMVDGQFKCFGSKQHIKNKFGTGYQVEIKFRDMKNEAVVEKLISLDIQNYLRENCPASYKIEQIKGEEVIMLNKEACILVLEKVLESNKALEEFHEEGFGNEIIIQLEKYEYYSIASLIKWEYVMRNNLEAITTLVNEFGKATLLEQYSPRYRYRVPKGDKSVGYFFGLMEKIKIKLDVDEYSASQTTLEQVFNGFARSTGVEVVQREFSDENKAGSENALKVYDPSLNKSELSDEEEE